MKINYVKLAGSIIVCQLAGFIGSFFTVTSAGSWYSTIAKPSFNPPNYVFGPVWITLYIMMGVSLYLLLESKKSKIALSFFIIQLALNTIWSIIFFGFEAPLFAFIVILLLWGFIALTIKHAYKISKPASYLLLPYIFWVSFAAILNFSIFLLNR